MKALSPLIKNKKAISNVVAYVLLISMGLALATLVYPWLKDLATDPDSKDCSEGTNIIIDSVNCTIYDAPNPDNVTLDLTIKNKGRFTINGTYIRIHDTPGVRFGEYELANVNFGNLKPGKEWKHFYTTGDSSGINGVNDVTFLEVQPYIIEDTDEILCKDISKQMITCMHI